MPYTYAKQSAVPQETMEALARVYGDRNIACHIGADTPF